MIIDLLRKIDFGALEQSVNVIDCIADDAVVLVLSATVQPC